VEYAETTAARRRIPVYLVDDTGAPANVSTPTGAQIQVSKSGGAWANGAGTWGEVDDVNGSYYYEATQNELTTDSFLLLRVAHPDAKVFMFIEHIGDRVPQNAAESERRMAVYLVDSAGDPVTDGETAPTLKLSINGGAFATLTNNTLTNIGSGHGGYYVVLTEAEVLTLGTRVLRVAASGALTFVYRFDVRDPVAVEEEALTPVPAPTTLDDQELHDHTTHALSRLCEFTKVRS